MVRGILRKQFIRSACLFLASSAFLLTVLDHLFPPDLSRYRDVSVLVLDRDDQILRAYTTEHGLWRLPIVNESVSPLYLKMLIAAEDKRFWNHIGVDGVAGLRALWQNLSGWRVLSGASTITMQVARLLHPRPRTVLGKLYEAIRALQLEVHFTKNEILNIYMTLAPFGGNIEGVRAASLAYFEKEPLDLSPAEVALLVSLPRSPEQLRPDRNSQNARQARNKLLGRMSEISVISSVLARIAMAVAVPRQRSSFPFIAPHLGDRLVQQKPEKLIHATFIDKRLQQQINSIAKDTRWNLPDCSNIAIVVAENAGARIRGHVGAADFWDFDCGGQIDLASAIRSPGSTLKPFIYALAFEHGAVHPETVLQDSATRFGDYRPSNFDSTSLGPVTVREALVRSLNVPAVKLLARVGPRRLERRLDRAGVELHYPKDALGVPTLPIGLGGVGLRLTDLVSLYAALANGGKFRSLRWEKSEPLGEVIEIFGPKSAEFVADILADVPAPPSLVRGADARTTLGLAYKTGTSFGFRDSWAVGFTRDYTIGIWIGRADGTPLSDHYGRNTAAPLLFRVFDLLPSSRPVQISKTTQASLDRITTELPRRLQSFEVNGLSSESGRNQISALQIDMPVNRSKVILPMLVSGQRVLPLVALGGVPPLKWIVNGEPIASLPHQPRRAEWNASIPGEVEITVRDELGQVARAVVWISYGVKGVKVPSDDQTPR